MAAAAIESAAAIEIVIMIMIPAHLAHAERRAGWPRHPAGSKRGSISNVRPRPSCARPDTSSESAYTACTATDTASHDMCAAPTDTAATEAASHDCCTAPNEAPTAAMPVAPTAAVSLSEPGAGGCQHQTKSAPTVDR